MAATLRLMRFGKKNYPTFRIVVLDKRKKRNGAYLESVGTYNPMTNPATINLNHERFKYWLKVGAQTSQGLKKLLRHKIKKDQN